MIHSSYKKLVFWRSTLIQTTNLSRKVYCQVQHYPQSTPAALPLGHIHILHYNTARFADENTFNISIIYLVLLLGHINTGEMNSTSNFQHTIEAAELLLLGGGGGGGEEELLFPTDFYYNDNNFMITNSSSPSNTFIHDDQNLSFLQQGFDFNDDFYTINNLFFPSTPSSTSSSENFTLLDPINDYNLINSSCYSNSYSSNNYPKRQKINYNHSIMNNPCSDFVTLNQYSCPDYALYPPSCPLPQFLPELNYLHSSINEAAAPMLPVLPYFSNESANKRSNNDKCLSAQSVAARQRRRKITEKTQQLGKLIPGVGNNKFNTAEMFQAAFKYVKFLQAQVGVLELMQPQQGNTKDSSPISMNMEGLLASPTVQEKLYSEEKCLVPNEFVQVLAKDEELKQSQPLISKELDSLLETSTTI